VEDRPDRVTTALRAAAGSVVGNLDGLALGPTTDAVSTDHDSPTVTDQLAVLLRAGIRFVGALGSKRRVELQKQLLRDAGCLEEEISRLRTPVGLDLGARTPAEISLSILAGLLAARTGKTGGWLDQPAPVATGLSTRAGWE
jgi:xanthine/CO dehydrogenase XdhC/CoxF family maturation factor